MKLNRNSPERIRTLSSLLILCTGVFVLLYLFFTHTSFWKDEVFLALNYLEQEGPTITLPLNHSQAAPIGFLQVNRWLESALGHSEQTFWLLSMLAGVGLLLGTWQFYKKKFPKYTDTIALWLVAFNATLLTYSVQFKPYILDTLIAFGLMVAFWSMPKENLKPKHYLGWIALGLLGLWMSFTSVFVIAGLGLWLIGEAWAHKRPKIAWGWVAANAVLAGTFLVLWARLYHNLDQSDVFYNFWLKDGGFFPWDSTLLLWFGVMLKATTGFLMGGVSGILVLLLIIIGAPFAWKLNKRSGALALPIILTLVAAGAHTYPVHSRLVLFWFPLILPFVALGIYRLVEISSKEHRKLGLLIGIVLAIAFGVNSIGKITHGNFQDIRSVASSIAQQAKPGDVVWVHPRAIDLYTYYFCRYALAQDVELTSSTKEEAWQAYSILKERYANKKVYVAATEAIFFLNELDLMRMNAQADGTMAAQIEAPIASGLLLDFTPKGK